MARDLVARRGRRRSPSDSRCRYPPIGDYALLSDCHTVALVGRRGSVDWLCLPRIDSGSVFGRLLDWERGGHCELTVSGEGYGDSRAYLEDSMVLRTTFAGPEGEARVLDALLVDPARPGAAPRLLRVVEGVRGQVGFRLAVSPRFDYGEVKPLIRRRGGLFTATGGARALFVAADLQLERLGPHDLGKEFTVGPGERVRILIGSATPREVRPENLPAPQLEELDAELAATLEWWRSWAGEIRLEGPHAAGLRRSALAIKALTVRRSGAIAAAATTSLPEALGGGRNWDYRFSWIRDSSFSVRALAEIGCTEEAAAFRRFVEESAAGAAGDLQIMYGVGGERRLTELELGLEGFRRSAPVRAGNGAYSQRQLDVFGELMDLNWRWHLRGHSPDDDYWRFIVELVETAVERWQEPDRGLWEIRGEPRHFVHSKVMLWAAVDRGIRLAEDCLRSAPLARWRRARDAIRRTVEKEGYDPKRNTFLQAFGGAGVDAALLLLPHCGFVDHSDPRMVGTVDAIRERLSVDGLLVRYRPEDMKDGLKGVEGCFLACSFWLAECLAHQGRVDDARAVFDRAASTGNDLGLFSEQFDPRRGELLGNFPQGLTHLSHITAGLALRRLSGRAGEAAVPPDGSRAPGEGS